MEVEGKKTQIEKYAFQQFQTKKNEEYRALGTEIETCKGQIAKIEDQMLELMEQADTVNAAIKEAAQVTAAELKDVETAKASLADKEIRLKKDLEKLKGAKIPVDVRFEQGLDVLGLTQYATPSMK